MSAIELDEYYRQKVDRLESELNRLKDITHTCTPGDLTPGDMWLVKIGHGETTCLSKQAIICETQQAVEIIDADSKLSSFKYSHTYKKSDLEFVERLGPWRRYKDYRRYRDEK